MWAPPTQPTGVQEGIEICKGVIDGMDKIILRHQNGFIAEVLLYGGQVISWSKGPEQFLFASSKATYKPETLVRGGIPICFPEFSIFGTTGSHGFVRHKLWEVDTSANTLEPSSGTDIFINLILKSTDKGSSRWPHKFEFSLRITLQDDKKLVLTSRIRNENTNGKPFEFRFAYHTYLAVSDISEVRIEGLEKIDYVDNLKNQERFTDGLNAITFDSEVERVYLDAPSEIRVIDRGKKRSYAIRKHGPADVFVWNPWDDEKSRSMQGLGKDEYKRMVCVEPAIMQKPKSLKPGEEWTGIMELSVVNSTEDDDDDDDDDDND